MHNEKLINKENIVIYGAGAYGEIAYYCLQKKKINPKCFVDRKFVGEKKFGLNIFEPEYIKCAKDDFYVIAVGQSYSEVLDFLKKNGCTKYINLLELMEEQIDIEQLSALAREFWFNRFLYKEYVREKDPQELVLGHVDFVTTECCTLKCKACSQSMPLYQNPKNIDIGLSLSCFERFLDSVDRISEIRVLGGEPFVNSEIYKVLEHLDGNQKIGQIVIYTNGTIIPNGRTLKDLSKGMAKVHISDYGFNKDAVRKFVTIMQENDIEYFERSYDYWIDLGDFKKRDYTSEQLQGIYDKCGQRYCNHFFENKFYVCPRVASASRLGFVDVPGDCVDFSAEATIRQDYRKQIEELLKRKKPFAACAYCNGTFDAEHIGVAEQG